MPPARLSRIPLPVSGSFQAPLPYNSGSILARRCAEEPAAISRYLKSFQFFLLFVRAGLSKLPGVYFSNQNISLLLSFPAKRRSRLYKRGLQLFSLPRTNESPDFRLR